MATTGIDNYWKFLFRWAGLLLVVGIVNHFAGKIFGDPQTTYWLDNLEAMLAAGIWTLGDMISKIGERPK